MAALLQSSFAARQQNVSFRANVADVSTLRVSSPRVQPLTVNAPLVVEARVRIRFTRMGRKKLPFYRIVAIDSRKRRDGAPLEYLGWYNPLSKEANLNAPAIKKWLQHGAEPSETVEALLKKAMVLGD